MYVCRIYKVEKFKNIKNKNKRLIGDDDEKKDFFLAHLLCSHGHWY